MSPEKPDNSIDFNEVSIQEAGMTASPAQALSQDQLDAQFQAKTIETFNPEDVTRRDQIIEALQTPIAQETIASLDNSQTIEGNSSKEVKKPEVINFQKLIDQNYLYPGTKFDTLTELQQSTQHSFESSIGSTAIALPLIAAGGALAFIEVAGVGGLAGILPTLATVATSGVGAGAFATGLGVFVSVAAVALPAATIIGGGLMLRHVYKIWKGKRKVASVAKKVSAGEMVLA